MGVQFVRPIKIFYCYAHNDNALRKQLSTHLSPLRRLRDIVTWFDSDIQAGVEWERESREQLETADIILLLISADFMASEYCYTIEMTHALVRHRAGTACVIPILLRPVVWARTPIGELSPLPTDRRPVTEWANPDAAWLNVVQGIGEIVRKLLPERCLSLQDADILYAEQGPLSGQTIGEKYLLGELIGEGGFSQVYKAQHLLVQRQQAVKVLTERHFRKLEFRNRFLREARTIASLDHPHIIHLDDFGVEATKAYLVMPYISEGTLQEILEKQQRFLERDQIVFYLECICAALDYAHGKEIAHLDLKPLNLLVHEDGRLLLSDFGLAHFTTPENIPRGSSLRAGTPHYMAPEYINGFLDKRSDLFSLGVILYQMLTGRLPFDGLAEDTVLVKTVTDWPSAPRVLRPELPQAVEDVLARALAKRPEQRYQTASELLVAFKKAISSFTYLQPVSISTGEYTPAWIKESSSTFPEPGSLIDQRSLPLWMRQLASQAPASLTAQNPLPEWMRSQQPTSPYIKIEEGKGVGQIYEIHKETLNIGRGREMDIFLEDLAVSRLHASILHQGNGNYILRDESANGTKVNEQSVSKYQTYLLQDGDRIQIGQTLFIFRLTQICLYCQSQVGAHSRWCGTCGKPVPILSAIQPNTSDFFITQNPVETCPQCGFDVTGKKFCPECGTPQQAALAKPATAICPSCGGSVKNGAAFCMHCGKPQPALTGMQTCPHCGGSVKNGAVFCMHCGSSLSSFHV